MTYNNTLFSTNKESEGALHPHHHHHHPPVCERIGQTCSASGRAANSVSRERNSGRSRKFNQIGRKSLAEFIYCPQNHQLNMNYYDNTTKPYLTPPKQTEPNQINWRKLQWSPSSQQSHTSAEAKPGFVCSRFQICSRSPVLSNHLSNHNHFSKHIYYVT